MKRTRFATLFVGLAAALLPGVAAAAQEPSGTPWHMEIRNIYGAEGFAAIYTFDPGLIVVNLVSSEVGHPTEEVGRRSLTEHPGPVRQADVGN